MTETEVIKTHGKEIDMLRSRTNMSEKEIEILKTVHKENCKDINAIKGDVKTIKENHLQHIETDVRELKTDVAWIKKIQWFAITTSVTTLVGIVVTIYLTLTQ
jgi:archaellum component FlaC